MKINILLRNVFQSTPLTRGETDHQPPKRRLPTISIHSPHTRGDIQFPSSVFLLLLFQSTPLMRGETKGTNRFGDTIEISIHSPHARGDSISLQKSIRIYVSLHNKTMIHRFSGLYKPLFAAQSPIFGVRSPRESHDSFTFARLSEGHGITP